MPWLMARLYDRLSRRAEEGCLRAWRRALLNDLSGDVLEIGAGTGLNLPHYGSLRRLVLVEPDRHMRARLDARLRRDLPGVAAAKVLAANAEDLPFPEASFDAVVATLVLCSVKDLERAVAEIHRVLRPGGRYAFLEHVRDDADPRWARWQERLDPLWSRVGGNCHLTRRTEEAIRGAGFELERVVREPICNAPPLVRPGVRGVARRAA